MSVIRAVLAWLAPKARPRTNPNACPNCGLPVGIHAEWCAVLLVMQESGVEFARDWIVTPHGNVPVLISREVWDAKMDAQSAAFRKNAMAAAAAFRERTAGEPRTEH